MFADLRAFLAEPSTFEGWRRLVVGAGLVLLAALAYLVAAVWVRRGVRRLVTRSRLVWDDLLFNDRLLRALSALVPQWVLYQGLPLVLAGWDRPNRFVRRLLLALMTATLLWVATHALDAVERIYRRLTIARTRPIKAFVQLVALFIYGIGVVVIAALLLDQPAWGFLSGLGALSAVLLLVFKDPLLGLAASFQISANNMVQIGDWIEMPKYNADGDVIDISLQTVKVQNFDKTVTSLPIYALVSDAFKNWRGMSEAGGRRIMRSICIDLRSVRFLDDALLERLKRVQYLHAYIGSKLAELEEYNRRHEIDASVPVNGRRLTNLGTFRAYMVAYLRNRPDLRQDMTMMVRQLDSGPNGVPLQVWAFTATTEWIPYEGIQSDIFDHFLAVLPEFGLRAFQNPSGWDFDRLPGRPADPGGA